MINNKVKNNCFYEKKEGDLGLNNIGDINRITPYKYVYTTTFGYKEFEIEI